MPTHYAKYVFNYRDSDWSAPPLVGESEWVQDGPAGDESPGDFGITPWFTRLDDLTEFVRDHHAVGQSDLVFAAEQVSIPFDKLNALMARGEWAFVGGTLLEQESHDAETEIWVVLQSQAAVA